MTEENIEETQFEEKTSQETEELDLDLDFDESDEQVEDNDSESEDVEALKAKLAETEENNKKLYARLKKGEKKKSVNLTQKTALSKEDVEEMFLKKDGVSEEEIDMLKTIQLGKLAKGEDINLMDALNDPLYVNYLQAKKQKELQEKASLGASQANGQSKVKKMTREEHRAEARIKAKELLDKMQL